jgi:hypothetical protein
LSLQLLIGLVILHSPHRSASRSGRKPAVRAIEPDGHEEDPVLRVLTVIQTRRLVAIAWFHTIAFP